MKSVRLQWILDLQATTDSSSSCVEWPWNTSNGYAAPSFGLGYGVSGRYLSLRPHVIACIMVNGAPSPGDEVCHGSYKDPCVSRSCVVGAHLRWDTRRGNLWDRYPGNPADHREVVRRYLNGEGTQAALAAEYGVTRRTVSSWVRMERRTGPTGP